MTIEGGVAGRIDRGVLVFLGVEKDDCLARARRLCERVLNYRLFADQQGKMNLNVRQAGGALLVVSQFTLVADTGRGNRPSFSNGASPEMGEQLYEYFVGQVRDSGVVCETGQFGADMQVSLTNDGPVTFWLQT